jgi:hypothetical protein
MATVCVPVVIEQQACYPDTPDTAKVTFFTSGAGSVPPNELWVTLENAEGPPMNPNIPNSFPASAIITPALRDTATDIVQQIINYYVASLPPPLP